MTVGQTIILRGDSQRQLAKRIIDAAPVDALVNVREMTRSNDQNAKLWAMLSDVSRAKPQGRRHTADVWKALMMHACGHETQFLSGLDGEPFPSGFRSSRLSVSQMRELIDFVDAWGSQNGVKWTWSESAYQFDQT
jgi:hypothetical protein